MQGPPFCSTARRTWRLSSGQRSVRAARVRGPSLLGLGGPLLSSESGILTGPFTGAQAYLGFSGMSMLSSVPQTHWPAKPKKKGKQTDTVRAYMTGEKCDTKTASPRLPKPKTVEPSKPSDCMLGARSAFTSMGDHRKN